MEPAPSARVPPSQGWAPDPAPPPPLDPRLVIDEDLLQLGLEVGDRRVPDSWSVSGSVDSGSGEGASGTAGVVRRRRAGGPVAVFSAVRMGSGWDGAQTDGSWAREAGTAGTPADVWFEIRWGGLSNGRLLANGVRL